MSNRGAPLPYGLPLDLTHLLYTNDPRVDYQVAKIAHSLAVARTLKSRLALEITDLRMNLMRLEREELHVARHIDHCEFALAPVRRVPTEILAHIFMSYTDLVRGTSCVDVVHGVWKLGYICSYWRTVALTTPELWTAFEFSCDTRVPGSRALAEAWLEHTGTRPLSVRFECQGIHTRADQISGLPPRGSACRHVLKALMARCARWESAWFDVPSGFFPRLSGVKGNLPLLEKLTIFVGMSADGAHDVDMFAVAPRLRDVRLSHLIRWSVRISLPWHQITRYKGDAYTVQATHILALAPNIEECTLIDNDAPAIPLTHRLHTLHIVNSPVSVITPPTLNVLTLPALQSLRLPAAPPLLDAAAALLVRSDAPLAALTVDNFAPTGYSEPIMALLAAAPSVRTLTLLGRVAQPEQMAAFFSALGPLLPRLQRLTLHGVAFGEGFVGWLESRCAAAGPDTDGLVHTARLEALSIADVHETHIAHLLRVRELAAAGTLELEDNGLAAVRVLA